MSRYGQLKKKNTILSWLLGIVLVLGLGAGLYAVSTYDNLDDKDKTTQVEQDPEVENETQSEDAEEVVENE